MRLSIHDKLEHDGITLTLAEWACGIGISNDALIKRLRRYDVATALSTQAGFRKPRIKYDPHEVLESDDKFPSGKRVCTDCGLEKRLSKFLPRRHSISGKMYRNSKCHSCQLQSYRKRNRSGEYRVCSYGGPEKTYTGKVYRTEHLEQYLRQSWNPYITIPDHAGRWYEPVAVYPDEIPGTGEVFGCAA